MSDRDANESPQTILDAIFADNEEGQRAKDELKEAIENGEVTMEVR